MAIDIGVWCNGNTTDSGPVILGSSPSTPTEEIAKLLRIKHLAISPFHFWRDSGVIDSDSSPNQSPKISNPPPFSVRKIQIYSIFRIVLAILGISDHRTLMPPIVSTNVNYLKFLVLSVDIWRFLRTFVPSIISQNDEDYFNLLSGYLGKHGLHLPGTKCSNKDAARERSDGCEYRHSLDADDE